MKTDAGAGDDELKATREQSEATTARKERGEGAPKRCGQDFSAPQQRGAPKWRGFGEEAVVICLMMVDGNYLAGLGDSYNAGGELRRTKTCH